MNQMIDQKIAKFNARLAIISSFFDSSDFILPIWLLYSLDVLHMKPTLAVAVFISIWITSALLEVPTGALADRLGRKRMFILGQFMLALYPLAYAFKFPVFLIVLTCLISALGSALRSGTLTPIVHSSYKKAGLSDAEYGNFMSTNQVSTFIARAVTGVTGALMYTVDPRLPFFAMFTATMANFGLGFFIRDMPLEPNANTNTGHIQETFRAMARSDIIKAILIAYVTLSVSAEAIWTGYQVFYQADGRSTFIIGLLFSIIAACSAAGAYSVRYAHGRLYPTKLLYIYGLGVAMTATMIAQPNINIRLLAILPMGFVSGITIVTLALTTQRVIQNKYHSTALSIINFAQYGSYAVGSLGFGLLLQAFSLNVARNFLLISSVVSVLAITAYNSRHKSAAAFAVAVE